MVLFINETTFKESSGVDKNLDWNVVKPTLKFVQDKFMIRLLGKEYYRELKGKVQSSNISPIEKELLEDYIRYVLIWNTLAEIQIPINYKVRNQGYVYNQNEDGNVLGLEDIKYTRQFYIHTAEFYNNELQEFLQENRKHFPSIPCIGINRSWSANINI